MVDIEMVTGKGSYKELKNNSNGYYIFQKLIWKIKKNKVNKINCELREY